MSSYKYTLLFFVLSAIVFISCKEEGPSDPVIKIGKSIVAGKAKFLDDAPGAFAAIELKSMSSGSIVNDTCDADGNFMFDSLSAGDYYLTFRSTGPDINSTSVKVTFENDEQQLTQDVTITYKRLDDFVAFSKNNDMFFLKVEPHGGHIGTRYDKVKYISGFYRNDWLKRATLTCEVYKLPEDVNWTRNELTVDSIRANFEFLMDVFEEPMAGNTHEIRIKGDGIPVLLSDPPNGFVFIKKYADDKELKIPCMDNVNNDFGFIITYN